MRNRLWDELMQSKHKQCYSLYVLQRKKNIVKGFTIVTLVFSGAGIMGWSIWKDFPLIACVIITAMQLIKLLQPQITSSDKELDKLNRVIKFYFDYHNKLEQLWYDYERSRISEEEAQRNFYLIKDTEKEINEIVNEVINKKINKNFYAKADIETQNYVQRTFN